MTLNLKRTENDINRVERLGINENWTKIENNFNNVVSVVGDKAFEEIVNTAKLVWQQPVDTFADLATTYPNAEIGWAAWARETVGGVSKAYRYDGTQWVVQQEFSGDAINEVDNRLTMELEGIEKQVNPSMSQSEIQTILNTYKNVKVLAGQYNVTIDSANNGWVIPSDRVINFDAGSTLKVVANDKPTYRALRVHDVSNIKINNPVIIGERNEHFGTTGEFGMGISIQNVDNVEINYPSCRDCWGDGIYVGNNVGKLTINYPVCDNNRRQGISIVSGRQLTIVNPKCINTNGTSPESGIDIEPNVGTSGLDNVRIINPITENNAGRGIVIALSALSNTDKVVNIVIDNHVDDGSNTNFSFAQCKNLKGNILINNPVWRNAKSGSLGTRSYRSTAPQIIVNNPVIINPRRDGQLLTSPKNGSVIALIRETNDDAEGAIGNVLINNLNIINSDIRAYANFSVFDELNMPVENIEVNGIISLGLSTVDFYTRSNQGVYKVVGYDVVSELTANGTISGTSFLRNFVNTTQSDARNVTLNAASHVGSVVTVLFVSPTGRINIVPENQSILTETIIGERLVTTTKGSYVKLKKINATEWIVLEKIGTWIKQTI